MAVVFGKKRESEISSSACEVGKISSAANFAAFGPFRATLYMATLLCWKRTEGIFVGNNP